MLAKCAEQDGHTLSFFAFSRARIFRANVGATSATSGANRLDLWCLRVQISLSEVLPEMLQVLLGAPDLSIPQKGGEFFQKVNEIFQNGGAVFQKVDAIF